MKYLLLLFVALATARGQEDFRAFTWMEDVPDGGRMETLTVVTSDLQFKFYLPKGWSWHADAASRQLLFESPSGRSDLKVLFLPKSPGTLPEENVLRERALQALPGGDILQTSVCPTGYVPGVFFDLVFRPLAGGVLKVRHAYVAVPHGQLECILAANGDEFETGKFVIMRLLQSLRVSLPNSAAPLVSGRPSNTNAVLNEPRFQNNLVAGPERYDQNPINHSIFIEAMPPQPPARPPSVPGHPSAGPDGVEDPFPDLYLPSLAVAALGVAMVGLRYYRKRHSSAVVFHDDDFETLWEPPPEVAPRKMAEETFFCKGNGVYGRGLYTKEGFVVLKTSIGRKENAASSAEEPSASLQAELLASGVIREQEDIIIFDRDHLFPTPSMAAAALIGQTVNGWLEWKTEDGITLDTVERLEPRQPLNEPAPSPEPSPSPSPEPV